MKKTGVKNKLKIYIVPPLFLVLLICLSFMSWFFMPEKELSIVVLDKTVPAAGSDTSDYIVNDFNNYRKHIGLYWLLDYMKIINPETGKRYDYEKDYCGPRIDQHNKVTKGNSIVNINDVPDIMYLSDTYGIESSGDRGISKDEMNSISMCHSNGSVIIGEQDILTTSTDEVVRTQLEQLFGMKTTGWVGKYVFELQDLTDIPKWAPQIWELKYGQEWNCSGPGLILVSSAGDILVLEEKYDFKSKNLMNISIDENHRYEFGKHSLNYYNWFELVQADNNTETIAAFSFNLNTSGAEKMEVVSNTATFAAVTRNQVGQSAPAYYFAGDFNDYISKKHISNFSFADILYRVLSYDREGDITNFYWNFYVPLMKKIISETEHNPADNYNSEAKQMSRIGDIGLEVMINNKWNKLDLKGFNINGEMPGDSRYSYSRDYDSFVKLVTKVVNMKANCIRAYDLLAPEFYRALYEVNKDSENPVYLIQGIMTPQSVTPAATVESIDIIKEYINSVLGAVRGSGYVITFDSGEQMAYSYDVNPYIIAYVIDPRISAADSDYMMTGNDSRYSYKGTYISSDRNVIEAVSAELCDYVLNSQQKKNGYMVPVSICYNAERLEGAGWTKELPDKIKYNISKLSLTDEAKELYFSSYSLNTDDIVLLDNQTEFSDYSDGKISYPYGGYIKKVKSLCSGPILIDRVGLSTNSNVFEVEKDVNGLTEREQGDGLVRLLTAAKDEGYIGALIADLNDNWSAVSESMNAYTIPVTDSGLWQNTTDRAETTGVVAADAVISSEVSMELNDIGVMQQMQLSTNETYVCITLLLNEEIDFDSSELMLGIDTYQRNNGEYYYDTHQCMLEGFNMYSIETAMKIKLQTQPIRGVYYNSEYPNLYYVDKVNGGKSDALNTGINFSSYPLFACLDADSRIEKDALLILGKEFYNDTTTVVAGGFVRIANGSVVKNGEWKSFNMPKRAVEKFQIVEYFRSFLAGRLSWGNALLIVSGAFGVFNKNIVIDAGGYKTSTIGEDMEIVVRIHRFMRDNNRKYSVKFCTEAICWTQGPMSMSDLRSQRRRWQIGLFDTLKDHWKMTFNYKYRLVGLVSIPYNWLFEFLGAIVEVIGYFIIPFSLIMGELNIYYFVIYFLLAVTLGIILSIGGIILEQYTHKGCMTSSQAMKLSLYAILENFGYRQIVTLYRFEGILKYRKLHKKWGRIKRLEFNVSDRK